MAFCILANTITCSGLFFVYDISAGKQVVDDQSIVFRVFSFALTAILIVGVFKTQATPGICRIRGNIFALSRLISVVVLPV